VYVKEQRRKVEEEKRLAQEAELKRRHETPGTWEHFQARCKETDIRTREANAWDTTSETEKAMPGLHPKPEGEPPECFCGDPYKMNVSGDYKAL
jgi:hypothetical protein